MTSKSCLLACVCCGHARFGGVCGMGEEGGDEEAVKVVVVAAVVVDAAAKRDGRKLNGFLKKPPNPDILTLE